MNPLEKQSIGLPENDCESADELMFLYIDGQVNEREAAFLENHLKVCEDCRKEFESRKEFLHRLGECNAAAPESLYPAVMEKIKDIPQQKRRLLPKHLFSIGAAVAACLVLGICLSKPYLTSPDPVLPIAESGQNETVLPLKPETEPAVRPIVPETTVTFETSAPKPYSPLETYSGEIGDDLLNAMIEITESVAPRPREVATLTALSSEIFEFLDDDDRYQKKAVTFDGLSATVYTFSENSAEESFLSLLGEIHESSTQYIASRPDSEITSYVVILILPETIS